LAKAKLAGENATAGALSPDPARGTTWVLAGAPLLLSVTVSVP